MNRRRLFQISLRTLLGLITVAAIGLGYITHRAREQRAAVARIKELGGLVHYDYQLKDNFAAQEPPGWPWLRRLVGDEYFQDVARVMLDKTPVSDSDLPVIYKLRKPIVLSLGHTDISDEGLVYFEGLSKLSCLDLRETKITSAGLGRLKPLPSVGSVTLSDTNVGDHGIKALVRWPSLSIINLDGTAVTSEGMKYLSERKSIRFLWLRRTKLDDSAVPFLGKLSNLEELWLDETQITGEGLLALHDQLPKCRIEAGLVDLSDGSIGGSLHDARESARWKQIATRLCYLDNSQYLKLIILSGSAASDGHLTALVDLKHVEVIDLRRTKVTDAGIATLQRALPKCKIVRE